MKGLISKTKLKPFGPASKIIGNKNRCFRQKFTEMQFLLTEVLNLQVKFKVFLEHLKIVSKNSFRSEIESTFNKLVKEAFFSIKDSANAVRN